MPRRAGAHQQSYLGRLRLCMGLVNYQEVLPIVVAVLTRVLKDRTLRAASTCIRASSSS